MSLPLSPPLLRDWGATATLVRAVSTGDRIYGVTGDGRIACLESHTGALRWQTQPGYLLHLGAGPARLFAFKRNQGLVVLNDLGDGYTETAGLPINPCDETTPLTAPQVEAGQAYFARSGLLVAVNDAGALLYQRESGDLSSVALHLWKPGQLLAAGSSGVLRLWRAGLDSFTLRWSAPPLPDSTGPSAICALGERAFMARGGWAQAVDFAGRRLWAAALPGGGARTLAALGTTLYAVAGSTITALHAETGALVWQRTWDNDDPGFQQALAVDGHLITGAPLMAVRERDGHLVWQGEGSLPLATRTERLASFGPGAPATGYRRLPLGPSLTVADVVPSPPLLRGAAFGEGSIRLQLKARGTVEIRPWQAASGAGAPVLPATDLGPGVHSIPWRPALPAQPQIARLLISFSETGLNQPYSLAVPVPVNTLPDIRHHWARASIEAMLFHGFVGGYPDLTFQPDNLVTRAESATIIAKSLGRTGPSPGFRSVLTDIAGHWAEAFIKALEEARIVSGFPEPDGTFTFRPGLPMTRGQEARILVNAYAVPPAPPGFATRFTDIGGHWAAPDVKALEAAGYINGFREPDGSFTYRPEQLLTRAELCALVVRIRNLTFTEGGEAQ